MTVAKQIEKAGVLEKDRQQSVQKCVKESSIPVSNGTSTAPEFSPAPIEKDRMADLAVPHDIRAKQDQLARLHEQAIGEASTMPVKT